MSASWEIKYAQQPDPMVTEECLQVSELPEVSSRDVELGEGQVLIALTHISVDPYMRGLMGYSTYTTSWKLGQPAFGGATAVVLQSNFEGLTEGDRVLGFLPWKSHHVVAGNTLKKLPKTLSPSLFIGGLGMPGLSAYLPFKKYADVKEGDVVFVSGAAGAVGSIFGQLCKNAGATVYGSAGTQEKVDLIKSLGYDDAFNYRETSSAEGLDALLQGRKIDVYFDNVGGETLEAVLPRMNLHGRVINCGMISQYNLAEDQRYGVKTLMYIVTSRLHFHGFIVSDWADEFATATQELVEMCVTGKLKPIETIVKGYQNVPSAFVGLFKGENKGKMVIQVSDLAQ